MSGARTMRILWRAIVGTIALYGLLLQPVLAAAAPSRLLSDHTLCVPTAPDESPAPASASPHQCCLAANLATPIVPPPGESSIVPWSLPDIATVTWPRHEATRLTRGPPPGPHSPRGPPLA